MRGDGPCKHAFDAAHITKFQKQPLRAGSILAITFTNKAGAELKRRLTDVLGAPIASRIHAGTFHKLALRLLRRYLHLLPGCTRTPAFAIAQEDDAHKCAIAFHCYPSRLLTPLQPVSNAEGFAFS